MINPFATAEMAAGYAADRPPLHARVLARVRADLAGALPTALAVDVGCGAGLSTVPLAGIAARCVGVEPAVPMLAGARRLAPGTTFLAGAAEHLPLPSRVAGLVTAAGSLNFTRVPEALAEIRRILAPDGVLVAYDWATAREFVDAPSLEAWFQQFDARCPRPPSEAVPLDPRTLERLADGQLRLTDELTFAWPLTLTADAYARYMLTETRVAAAVRRGEPLGSIADWCHATLAEVFDRRARDVVFRGYIAYLRPA